jgi:hypothetical protein
VLRAQTAAAEGEERRQLYESDFNGVGFSMFSNVSWYDYVCAVS